MSPDEELGTLHIMEAFKKKYGIIWEFFPTWGGGLPKTKNQKKITLDGQTITFRPEWSWNKHTQKYISRLKKKKVLHVYSKDGQTIVV